MAHRHRKRRKRGRKELTYYELKNMSDDDIIKFIKITKKRLNDNIYRLSKKDPGSLFLEKAKKMRAELYKQKNYNLNYALELNRLYKEYNRTGYTRNISRMRDLLKSINMNTSDVKEIEIFGEFMDYLRSVYGKNFDSERALRIWTQKKEFITSNIENKNAWLELYDSFVDDDLSSFGF